MLSRGTGRGTAYGYSVTNCNLVTTDVVPPRQYGIVNFCNVGCPSITPKEYVVIARTLHNKIVTFRVVFR
jgi:hypothetical protein